MGTVFQFNKKRILSLKEAREILPVIRKVTEDAHKQVNQLLPVLEAMSDKDSEKRKTLEREVNELIEAWQAKIEKLGGDPKGLWLVDFDAGVGYFCWKFPEDSLQHFHGYTEGFKSRTLVDEGFDVKYQDPSEHFQPQL